MASITVSPLRVAAPASGTSLAGAGPVRPSSVAWVPSAEPSLFDAVTVISRVPETDQVSATVSTRPYTSAWVMASVGEISQR